MGWLTKILKGSSHKVSDGHYNGRYSEDRSYEQPRHSSDGSDFDKEDIDCAIALSLSELDHEEQRDNKGKKVIEDDSESGQEEDDSEEESEEYIRAQLETVASEEDEEEEKKHCHEDRSEEERAKTQLEEDEQLAKAIQESLITESPQYDSGSLFQPHSFFFPSSYRQCAGCHGDIGHGRFLSCMGGVWHPECFRCHGCNKPITDYEFSMSGNHPYHKLCYKDQHHPRCDVCTNFIPANAAGLIEFRAHPFWMQKYCPAHERDGTPRCCSCERMEPKDMKVLMLNDGRKLCLECLDSSIMDTNECQTLYVEIREFYEGLNMKVEQQIPMLLVERSALNEAMEGEINGHHHLPETRGLCLSEEQTVTTVSRRPVIGSGYRLLDMITEPRRLIRRCEVTAILILYGLPRLLTGSILAHEMMHAWLRLNGYSDLRPEVEEGICQVLAHMWLESETYSSSASDVPSSSSSSSSSLPIKKGERSEFEKKLGDFFKHQIESDSSTAYGDGFRQGNRAVLKYGLRGTLDHIRMTGSFP